MIAERQMNQGVASRESFKKSRFDASQYRGGESGSVKVEPHKFQRGGGDSGRGQGRFGRDTRGGESSSLVRRSGRGEAPTRVVTSFFCKEEGNYKSACHKLKGVECYHCHQVGHIKKNYPLLA